MCRLVRTACREWHIRANGARRDATGSGIVRSMADSLASPGVPVPPSPRARGRMGLGLCAVLLAGAAAGADAQDAMTTVTARIVADEVAGAPSASTTTNYVTSLGTNGLWSDIDYADPRTIPLARRFRRRRRRFHTDQQRAGRHLGRQIRLVVPARGVADCDEAVATLHRFIPCGVNTPWRPDRLPPSVRLWRCKMP